MRDQLPSCLCQTESAGPVKVRQPALHLAATDPPLFSIRPATAAEDSQLIKPLKKEPKFLSVDCLPSPSNPTYKCACLVPFALSCVQPLAFLQHPCSPQCSPQQHQLALQLLLAAPVIRPFISWLGHVQVRLPEACLLCQCLTKVLWGNKVGGCLQHSSMTGGKCCLVAQRLWTEVMTKSRWLWLAVTSKAA